MARTPRLVSLAVALTLAVSSASIALEEEPAEASGVSTQVAPLVAKQQARRTTGRIAFAPAPVGQKRSDRKAGLTPGTVRFSPARPGAGVRIERLVRGKWLKAATTTQDKRGRARFNVRAVKPGNTSKYRAVTSPGKGKRNVATPAVVPRAQQRVFVDGFDSVAKYRKQWRTRNKGMYHGRRMCAAPSPSRVGVINGSARLSVKQVGRKGRPSPANRKFTCVGGIWHNAMVGTGNAAKPFSFRYGTAAARVKFQPGQGMHSGFWLQTMGAGGAEIDIAEYYGNGYWAGLQSKIHQTTANGGLRTHGGTMNLSPVLAKGKTPASGWHVYSVEWTPKRYVFRVDGVVTMVTSKPHVSKAQQEVVMSLLTSDWALDDRVLKTKESSKVAVDWVQVWQDPQHIGK